MMNIAQNQNHTIKQDITRVKDLVGKIFNYHLNIDGGEEYLSQLSTAFSVLENLEKNQDEFFLLALKSINNDRKFKTNG